MATGFTLVFFEVAFGFPMVLFICGLAAFTTSLAIWAWPVLNDMFGYQVIIFLTGIVAWAFALWKPLGHALRNPKSSRNFSNIIGQTAVVDLEELLKGKIGNIKWSGTVVKAQLDPNCNISSLKVGEQVVVVDIKENIFIVEPKN